MGSESLLVATDLTQYPRRVGHIEIDTAHEPIWLLRYPATARLEDFHRMHEELRKHYRPGLRRALIIDLRHFKPLTVDRAERRAAADYMRSLSDEVQPYAVCEARVASNSIMRAVMTVFDWYASVPWPVASFTSGAKAEIWVRARLGDEGIELPTTEVWPLFD